MSSPLESMIDVANLIFGAGGDVFIYTGTHRFRVHSAQIDDDARTVVCRRRSDNATIVLSASAITAVEEIAESYT